MRIAILLVHPLALFDNLVNFSSTKSRRLLVRGACRSSTTTTIGEVFGGGTFGKLLGVFILGNNICYFGSNQRLVIQDGLFCSWIQPWAELPEEGR